MFFQQCLSLALPPKNSRPQSLLQQQAKDAKSESGETVIVRQRIEGGDTSFDYVDDSNSSAAQWNSGSSKNREGRAKSLNHIFDGLPLRESVQDCSTEEQCFSHKLFEEAKATQSIIAEGSTPSKNSSRSFFVSGDQLSVKKKPVNLQWTRKDTGTTVSRTNSTIDSAVPQGFGEKTTALAVIYMGSYRPAKFHRVNNKQ